MSERRPQRDNHNPAGKLALPRTRGFRILECREAPRGLAARYLGLRLEPV